MKSSIELDHRAKFESKQSRFMYGYAREITQSGRQVVFAQNHSLHALDSSSFFFDVQFK
jgi:hypothetical protein